LKSNFNLKMRRSSAARLGLLLALGAQASCAGMSPPAATPLDASRANVDLAELQSGRKLLISKCGSCHRPPMPSAHSRSEWPSKLDDMSERSKLDAVQRQQIERYLLAMAVR
jgi:hypothetical protein